MNKTRKILESMSERLVLPRTVAAGLPQTVVNGFGEVTIDLQQGLIAFSETEIVVAVPLGNISVVGTGLNIRMMKERAITITGGIQKLEFSGEKPT